jgi:hypothetical protein
MKKLLDSITDISGLRVGHWTDRRAVTGCTVVLCEKGAVAGIDVRGGAPVAPVPDADAGDVSYGVVWSRQRPCRPFWAGSRGRSVYSGRPL